MMAWMLAAGSGEVVGVSRSLIAAVAVGAGAMLAVVPAQAGVAPGESYVDAVVGAWRVGSVYVDRTQHLLMTGEDAAGLAERVRGQDPAIHVAVVPAVALSTMSGATDDQRGFAFVREASDRFGGDGHFFVVFGGTGTYSGSVGVGPPADVALTGQLDKFTRGEPAALLNAVLDELGVPELQEAGRGGLSPFAFVLVGVMVAAVAVGGLLWWRRRRSAGHGPALYRPSFEVLPDELDTLEERRALAREDVTRFGEEISAADLPLEDPDVAADVQAAMDAYFELGGAVDDEPDDLVLRAVRATSEYGRWRLACARARLDGHSLPPRRADCFFDARHGVSVADWLYTPANGVRREVPVCAGCRDLRAGVLR
jgi:hypothetical protein